MQRPIRFPELIQAYHPEGTLAALKAAREPCEKLTDTIRRVVATGLAARAETKGEGHG